MNAIPLDKLRTASWGFFCLRETNKICSSEANQTPRKSPINQKGGKKKTLNKFKKKNTTTQTYMVEHTVFPKNFILLHLVLQVSCKIISN